jgi:UDP-2-acetamido-3-amino-2,3-dideoxy-glucuronate N-acetyltransferase
MLNYFITPSSIVEEDVTIGDNTYVWYYSHIRTKAKIGRNCNIGDNVFIGEKVIIGDSCRIGNNAFIPKGVILRDKVFIGPHVVFLNVRHPRPGKKGEIRDVVVDEGVSIGAGAKILAGLKIGRDSFIGEGAVVVTDVPPESHMVGNPAFDVKQKKLRRTLRELNQTNYGQK